MKPQDCNNLFDMLRNNFGAIIFALFIVLYHICKTHYKTVKKLLSGQFNKYTSPQSSINIPIRSIEGPDSQYVRISCFGGSYLIIKCPELAAKIIGNADIFESATFTSQTFALSLNLLHVSHEKKNFKKLLNVVLRTRVSQPCTSPREESLIDDALKNSVEYPIHSNELLGRTKVVIPLLRANGEKKPYPPKLYPSLATNESSDTETRLRTELSSGLAVATESTLKMDTNMELLLSERFAEEKQRQAVKECYYNISQPFTLMKVQTERLTGFDGDGRIINSNNGLITSKSSHSTNANDKSIEGQQLRIQLESSFLLMRYCIKELIVLFEAKSNRRNTVNINLFSYRHAVNTLGVCLFGKHISQLSSSTCEFYQVCDDLIDILRDQQKNKIVQYFNDFLQQFQSSRQSDRRVQRIADFFNKSIDECLAGKCEGYGNSLVSVLFQQFPNDWVSQCDSYQQLRGSLSAFLISFTINVLETLSGSMSLIIRQLAKDTETQEKIRINDKVEFNLEGFPFLNLQSTVESTLSNSIIEEALENHPVDPITPFICKYPYRIHETKILVNPTCVILVPRHVLRNSRQIDCKGKWPERETPSGGFIVDLETQSFNLFVQQFVEICLKLSVTSLLQQYEFTFEDTPNDPDDEIADTSCRFTTLPSDIFVNVSRVDKRGKVITFEESLKAFHAMKNASLSWRTILSKWFPNTLVISS